MNNINSIHRQSGGCSLCRRQHQCARNQAATSELLVQPGMTIVPTSGQLSINSSFQNQKNHAGTTTL